MSGGQVPREAFGLSMDFKRKSVIERLPAVFGGRTETRRVLLVATGREKPAWCGQRVIASGACRIARLGSIIAKGRDSATQQSRDDHARNDPAASRARHRRENGTALATVTADGRIACIGPMIPDVTAMTLSAHGWPWPYGLRPGNPDVGWCWQSSRASGLAHDASRIAWSEARAADVAAGRGRSFLLGTVRRRAIGLLARSMRFGGRSPGCGVARPGSGHSSGVGR